MTTTTSLTLDEFLRLPETEPASEYADGEVLQKPMPTTAHAKLQLLLGMLLLQFATGRRDHVGSEWRCVFGPAEAERAFVPDIAYIAQGRLTSAPSDLFDAFRGAPDLAVEILSPDQSPVAFADKIQFYLLHGVRLVWAVDPMHSTVTVFSPGTAARTLSTDDTLDGGDVLPDFTLRIADLFAQLQF